MIEYTRGDLLDFTTWNVIGHCANCQNTMGAGIAKEIKARYPAAFQADREAFEAGRAQLGQFSTAVIDDKRVVNLYGQFRYGREKRHLDYEAIYTALESLKLVLEDAQKEGRIYSLGLPQGMGCQNSGGNWLVVHAMIKALFLDSPIRCVIVELIHVVKAPTPALTT